MFYGGYQLKGRVTLAELQTVLAQYALYLKEWDACFARKKKIREKFRHLKNAKKCLLSILRTLGSPAKKKYFDLIPQLMEKVELVSDKVQKQKPPEQTLTEALSWVAARVHKTPQEIAESCTSEELRVLANDIIRRDFEKAVHAIKAQHAPKKFLTEIKKHLLEIKNSTKRIEDKVEDKSMDLFDVFRKACLQPH